LTLHRRQFTFSPAIKCATSMASVTIGPPAMSMKKPWIEARQSSTMVTQIESFHELRHTGMTKFLVEDQSCMRISPPQGPAMLIHMTEAIEKAVTMAAPLTTQGADTSAFKSWSAMCALLGTPAVRQAVRWSANYHEECRREEWLQVVFVMWHFRHMKPKSTTSQAPKVDSAKQAMYGVRRYMRRVHQVAMPKPTMVAAVLKGMQELYKVEHGAEALLPKRKEPFTIQIIATLLAIPNGVRFGTRLVDNDEHFWIVWRAFVSLKCSGGFRTAELALPALVKLWNMGRAARLLVSWIIGQILFKCPTLAQLRSIRNGDTMVFTPPPSKTDPLGLIYSSKPLYLVYDDTEAINAPYHMLKMELSFPCLSEGERKTTPLFTNTRSAADPILASYYQALLPKVLVVHAGLTPARAACYSWHSCRIFLACALMAAGYDEDTALGFLRWQSKESLRLYARINLGPYGATIRHALQQDITSVSAANIRSLTDQPFLQDVRTLALTLQNHDYDESDAGPLQ
jgi:hypothetical protein